MRHLSLTARTCLMTGLALTLSLGSFNLAALSKSAASQPAQPAKSQAATKQAVPASKQASVKKEPKPILDAETQKAIETAGGKLDPDTRNRMNQLSDSLHLEDKAINNEIRDEEELSVTDIGMLWEAAVERSGTIRYAIEKLSRKDATGKPLAADNFSKRMVGSLVHLGGVAGTMWTGTPAGLIGSNMIQDLMAGNPQDPALSRVTDADMVILAKEVESLQTQLVELYYGYKNAKERLALAKEAQTTINRYYDHADSSAAKPHDKAGTIQAASTSDALQPLMQSIVESAQQDVQNAQQNYSSSRTALSLLVGTDAVAALDQANTKKNTQ